MRFELKKQGLFVRKHLKSKQNASPWKQQPWKQKIRLIALLLVCAHGRRRRPLPLRDDSSFSPSSYCCRFYWRGGDCGFAPFGSQQGRFCGPGKHKVLPGEQKRRPWSWGNVFFEGYRWIRVLKRHIVYPGGINSIHVRSIGRHSAAAAAR